MASPTDQFISGATECRFELQPSCPHELRKHLTSWLRHSSSEGAKWAEEALLLRPCDLWPYLKGRTVWVAGDSMSQVGAWAAMPLNLARPSARAVLLIS